MQLPNWTSVIGSDANKAAELLNKKSALRHVERGTFLIHQDEAINHVFLVTSGLLEAVSIQIDGSEVWLADLQPGDIVGEVSALYSHKSSSSVVAHSPSQVLAVSRSEFLSALDSCGKFAHAVASLLAERIANTSQNLSDKVSKNVQYRLFDFLQTLATVEDETGVKRVVSPPPISEICERIHATREATSRAMTKLQRTKRVRRVSGEIVIAEQ